MSLCNCGRDHGVVSITLKAEEHAALLMIAAEGLKAMQRNMRTNGHAHQLMLMGHVVKSALAQLEEQAKHLEEDKG